MEKICVVCGKSFITSGRRAKFCSYECSKVAGKSHRVKPDGWVYHGECLQCGKRFESTRTKKYCSAECQCNFQLNKAKMERLQAKPLCKQCGKQLPLKRSMFCSDACQKLSEKKTDIIWAPLTDEIIRQRIANHYDNIEHISGHKSDGRLIVRCKVCGGEFQMGERVTRKGNSDNIFPCPHCSKAKPVEPKRIVACAVCGKEFEGTKASKCCSNECRKVYARQYYSERARQIHEQISEEITCKQCGIVFTPEYGDKRKGFCSKECCKKYSHKYQKHITRALKKGNGQVDRDITLDALIRRDKNVCHICGGKCSKRDHIFNHEGYFIAGDNYPSIDHVVPMSKGGAHTWDNIRLAHFKCNRVKSNLLYYERSNGQMALAI